MKTLSVSFMRAIPANYQKEEPAAYMACMKMVNTAVAALTKEGAILMPRRLGNNFELLVTSVSRRQFAEVWHAAGAETLMSGNTRIWYEPDSGFVLASASAKEITVTQVLRWRVK